MSKNSGVRFNKEILYKMSLLNYDRAGYQQNSLVYAIKLRLIRHKMPEWKNLYK